jgi:hypothetical protein
MNGKMTAEGVEPSTLALKVRCSTTELRGHVFYTYIQVNSSTCSVNSIPDLSSLFSTGILKKIGAR